jgi:integrase
MKIETPHIRQHHNKFQVRIPIPKSLRHMFNGHHALIKALESSDIHVAAQSAPKIIAGFRKEIEEAKVAALDAKATRLFQCREAYLRDRRLRTPDAVRRIDETVEDGYVPQITGTAPIYVPFIKYLEPDPQHPDQPNFLKHARQTKNGREGKEYAENSMRSFVHYVMMFHRDVLLPLHLGLGDLDRIDSSEIVQKCWIDNVGEKLTRQTVKCHLSALRRYWAWMLKRGFVKNRNPFARDSLELSGQPSVVVAQYAAADVVRIIVELYNRRQINVAHASTIAAFTGMRRTSIERLTCNQIRTSVDGIQYIHVPLEDGKTRERDVPINPALQPLIDYLVKHAKNGRLFDGDSGDRWRRRVYDVIRDLGIIVPPESAKDAVLSPFHSFRHSFGVALDRANVEEKMISHLMGHAIRGITTAVGPGMYGAPKPIMPSFRAIKKLSYPGIPLHTTLVERFVHR